MTDVPVSRDAAEAERVALDEEARGIGVAMQKLAARLEEIRMRYAGVEMYLALNGGTPEPEPEPEPASSATVEAEVPLLEGSDS